MECNHSPSVSLHKWRASSLQTQQQETHTTRETSSHFCYLGRGWKRGRGTAPNNAVRLGFILLRADTGSSTLHASTRERDGEPAKKTSWLHFSWTSLFSLSRLLQFIGSWVHIHGSTRSEYNLNDSKGNTAVGRSNLVVLLESKAKKGKSRQVQNVLSGQWQAVLKVT